MSRKLPIYTVLALMGVAAASCNSDPEQATVSTYESTAVDAFSLKANDKVLAHLDSVYFSIDLNNGRIFNADSLPKGTDVSRLAVNVSTTAVGRVELIVNRGALGDTIYNYTASQNDSIDFSHGPVTLRITAQNGDIRNYSVNVNVHKMEPDSLYWNRSAVTALPTSLDAVVQKSVKFRDQAVTLTADADGNACIALSDDPADGWQTFAAQLPADADVRSLTATTDALYILDAAGALYTASSPEASWTATGERMSTLLGGYGSTLLAVKSDTSGKPAIAGYPAGRIASMPVPDGFPVKGSSELITFQSKWSENPTAVLVGGETSDGKFTGSAWAFDGDSWACINSTSPLPQMSGYSLVSYYGFITNADWSVDEYDVLLAMGGRGELGVPSHAVYISWDRGITWRLAATTMHLPDYLPAFAYADALVFTSSMSVDGRASTLWNERPDDPMPRWWRIAEAPLVRATAPITSWECPYLYLFGGLNGVGTLYDTVWRGVINRLTFVPLY